LGVSSAVAHLQTEMAEVWHERDVRNSFQAQRRPCPSVEEKTRWWRMTAFVHGGRCRHDQMKGAGLSRSRFVAGIGELPTPVGLADTVLVVLVVVGSQLYHGALPASSSYDTYRKRFQGLPVPDPISRRTFRLYSGRRVHTDDRSVAREHSSEDTHQGPIHGCGGVKGFLDYQISEGRELITIASPTS